jgi:hypothetical protein
MGYLLACAPKEGSVSKGIVSRRSEKIDFWDNVYGFNMSAIKRLAMEEPLVDVVDREQIATKPCLLATFNLAAMCKQDAAFSVTALRSQSASAPCHTA